MAQPVWVTPVGSLGTIQEGFVYRNSVLAEDPDSNPITYKVIAGTLPDGVQFLSDGTLSGIPYPVGRDVISQFTVRATTTSIPPRIADRTFSITVTGNNVPTWVTPAGLIGNFYTSQRINFQFEWSDNDPDDTVEVRLVAGELPGGLSLSSTGLLTGYVQPPVDIDALPGYELTAAGVEPYDFIYQAVNRNYQFTLETTDGKTSDLRTFSIFVINRKTLNASTTQFTGDNSVITADETTANAPFIANSDPSDLGFYRSNNYYAYQFQGEDYDNSPINYAISVNEGVGLPPGLELDPKSGWYYGYIPDQGATETPYSFNIVVYKQAFDEQSVTITSTDSATNYATCSPSGILKPGQPFKLQDSIGGLTANTIYYVGSYVDNTIIQTPVMGGFPTYESYTTFDIVGETLSDDTGNVTADTQIECTDTEAGTNLITCFSTERLGIGQPLVFTGTGFGGIDANPQQVYYVHSIESPTEFTVSTLLESTTSTELTTASGSMVANLIVASEPYPFLLTVGGAVDSLVTWITDSDLGNIVNGSTSILKVEAENRGGRDLEYRLKSGAYNLLPQGLELLPSGDIAGRVSFDTFSLDLGKTTFDTSFAVNRNATTLGTTFDSTFEFTVNAYAPDTAQILYKVQSVTVVDGGTGYSSITPPTIVFSAPIDGATSVQALVGDVTVIDGSIVSVDVLNAGDGYIDTATLTITQGFGGSGAELTAVMIPSGTRDVVSAFKTFNLRVIREYNEPYQNLLVQAMPPQNDREIIASLLTDTTIFPSEWLYRPTDPNFGLATNVTYAHAYGLSPDTLDVYTAALYENHYWKNLVLGPIQTAQALDAAGNVIYEVVYSFIIDNLVNNDNVSVGKIVTLPYKTVDDITQVYPNSLDNMRTQMIDVVGQTSTALPLWMTSKQTNGNVLGYTPAWVIAYTIPGKSKEIAYRIQTDFFEDLNQIDFKVDRYILDAALSTNWNYTGTYISGHNPPPGPVGDVLVGPGIWDPYPANATTFDRFNTDPYTFLSTVNIATRLAFTDVNGRTLSEINDLGGFDGLLSGVDGNTLIFVKQEDYDGPPGSNYTTTNAAWQKSTYPYDSYGFSEVPATFDQSATVPGGGQIECLQTYSTNNQIRCNFTGNLQEGQEIVFVINSLGGIELGTAYYILDIVDATNFTITDTPGGVVAVSLTNDTGLMYGDAANERMAVYTISVDPITSIVTLELTTQTHEYEYVQILRGDFYSNAYLYYPGSPGPGQIRVAWQPVVTVVTQQTTFDQNSLQFIEPVDMYNPGQSNDKYLVFPKSNILV